MADEAYTIPSWIERYAVMKTSTNGIGLIHSWEQFRHKAYADSGGTWTVGWGSTRIFGRSVRRGDYVTREEGDEQFEKDLVYFENAVESYVRVRINQNQFDALMSLCYNIGAGGLRRSKVLKHLNNHELFQAGESFMRHVYTRHRKTKKLIKLKGLVRRRKAEKKLFLSVTPDFSKLKPRGLTPYIIWWERFI